MIRFLLLVAGCLLLLFQHYVQPVPVQLQFIFFMTGILLVGIPHGAADLLVATQNAENGKRIFSRLRFFANYLLRLFLFAAIIWFFPLAGNLLFIVFAAYHFGETDLYQFKTNSLAGKLFVVSYGLLILAVILLNHFDEVVPLLKSFNAGINNMAFINWLGEHRIVLLSLFAVFFFASTFLYFITAAPTRHNQEQFLVQFAVILFILYNLPMLLGFTFYFVVWHSVLSLKNIVTYLRMDGTCRFSIIAKQIVFYSLLAIIGMSLFGFTGFMFVSHNTIMVYVFLALAVLTAPHMQIMHDMYKAIRSKM